MPARCLAARSGRPIWDALATRAENFDASVSGSLTRFLAYAEHMRARGDGDSAHLLGEGDDVVRLMTIHKSKGLEFPVVFGALTARSFRGATGGEPFRAHRALGLGVHYVDQALRTRREPLSYVAIGERERPRGRRRGTAPFSTCCSRAPGAGSFSSAVCVPAARAPAALRGHGDLPQRRRQPLAADARGVGGDEARRGKPRWRLSPFTAWTSFPRPATEQPRPEATDALDAALRQAGGRRTRPWPGSIPIAWTARAPSNSPPPAFCARAEGPRELPGRWPNGRSSCRKRA